MATSSASSLKIWLAVTALLGWFALIAQYYLIVETLDKSLFETTLRYFSYFTVLTNIMIAVYSTLLLWPGGKRFIDRFWGYAATATSLTVYIIIVGLIYNLFLRHLWHPQGLQFFVDELLHCVIPILFLLYWILYVPKEGLKWNDILLWLIYPSVYLVLILIRGEKSGFYPYPFIDVIKIGYVKTIKNSIVIALGFAAFSLLFVGVGKLIKKR